jgi:hypothetical protein
VQEELSRTERDLNKDEQNPATDSFNPGDRTRLASRPRSRWLPRRDPVPL